MNAKKKEKLYIELYKQYNKDMFCYALKLTKSKAEAEDVIQESLLRAWNGLDKLKDVNSAKYWLLTIVKREFLRKINESKKMALDDIDNHQDKIHSNINLDTEMEMNDVMKVVLMLEDEYKDVLILQGVYGYKIKEISKILKINENTVSTRGFRARKKLIELMGTKLKKERVVSMDFFLVQ